MKSDLVEQAVFTSARGDLQEGYHLVAASSGISDAESQELSRFGPSHDSLSEDSRLAGSLNFLQLSSGRMCVSRTTNEGAEYSARGGQRIHTHYFVLPPHVFRRFGNNPFRVLEAAVAGGRLDSRAAAPPPLEPFRLLGKASAIDDTLVQELVNAAGPQALANLVQSAVNAQNLAIKGTIPADRLIAGLLSLIPPQCRPEMTFSTGLRHSPSRPFRVIAIEAANPDAAYSLARTHEMVSVDYVSARSDCLPELGTWGRCLLAVLRNQDLRILERIYKSLPSELALRDLDRAAADLIPNEVDRGRSTRELDTHGRIQHFVQLNLQDGTRHTSNRLWQDLTKGMPADEINTARMECLQATVEYWEQSEGSISAEHAMSFLSSIVTS